MRHRNAVTETTDGSVSRFRDRSLVWFLSFALAQVFSDQPMTTLDRMT
jgi:hypothetical protein